MPTLPLLLLCFFSSGRVVFAHADPAPCQEYRSAGHTYRLCAGDWSWPAAQDICQAQGMALVTIETPEEGQRLWTLIQAQPVQLWWTGLTDQDQEGQWRWADGSGPPDWLGWYPREPNGGTSENCMHLGRHPEGAWNDARCLTHPGGALCEAR